MPFAGYPDFGACVSANQDKASPEGFCAWLHKQATGTWPGETLLTQGMPLEAQTLFFKAFEASIKAGRTEAEAVQDSLGVLVYNGWMQKNTEWVMTAEHSLEMKTVAGIQIFAVGEHNGEEYTAEDLESMAVSFQELRGRIDPPVTLGHSSDEFNMALAEKLGILPEFLTGENGQGAMALGWVTNVRRQGNVLVADFTDVPKPVAELIESRSYNKVSVTIMFDFEDQGKTHPMVISSVALLGAELPAVREIPGLEKAAVFTHTSPGKTFEFAVADGKLTYEELEPDLQKLEEAIESVIHGQKGARVLRALWGDVKGKVKSMFGKKQANGKLAEILDKWSAERQFHTVEERIRFIRSDLGLPEDATIDDIIAKLQSLKDTENMAGEGSDMMSSVVAVALGLPEEATEEQILAAIEELKAAAGKAAEGQNKGEFAEMKQTIAKLSTDLASEKRLRRVGEFTEAVRALPAIGDAEGRAEHLMELEEINPALAAKHLEELKSMNEQMIAVGITKSLGTSKEGELSGRHQFELEAEKKAVEEGIEYDVAFGRLASENRPLYHEYRKSQGKK